MLMRAQEYLFNNTLKKENGIIHESSRDIPGSQNF